MLITTTGACSMAGDATLSERVDTSPRCVGAMRGEVMRACIRLTVTTTAVVNRGSYSTALIAFQNVFFFVIHSASDAMPTLWQRLRYNKLFLATSIAGAIMGTAALPGVRVRGGGLNS